MSLIIKVIYFIDKLLKLADGKIEVCMLNLFNATALDIISHVAFGIVNKHLIVTHKKNKSLITIYKGNKFIK